MGAPGLSGSLICVDKALKALPLFGLSLVSSDPSHPFRHHPNHRPLPEAYRNINPFNQRGQSTTLNHLNQSTVMASTTAAVPATCCGREGGCVCAKEATCSCGKQAAMHCNCEKAATENKTEGARCSCSRSTPHVAAGDEYERMLTTIQTNVPPALARAPARRRRTRSLLARLVLVGRGPRVSDDLSERTKKHL